MSEESSDPVDKECEQLSFFSAPTASVEVKADKKPRRKSKIEPETIEQPLPDSQPLQGKEPMNITEPELKIDFEASLAELENVVKELDGEVKLEKALQLFEQGIKLSVECEQFIKGAEAKIEILKKQADGSLATEIFKGERVDLDD
jgi:exodeoxyribonuclease VII small subunit